MTLAMQLVLFVAGLVLLVRGSAFGIPVLIHRVVVAALAVDVAIGAHGSFGSLYAAASSSITDKVR